VETGGLGVSEAGRALEEAVAEAFYGAVLAAEAAEAAAEVAEVAEAIKALSSMSVSEFF
jgi:hypothetical protein